MPYQPLVKICGVKTPDILDHVIAQGADMVGFVHFPASPRHLPLPEIAALADRARGRIATVILLVDPDDSLADAAAATGVDWLQMHGHESPDRVAAVRARSGKLVLKALPIGNAQDVAAVPAHAGVADRLILDARPPRDATRPGGLGTMFDWGLLNALDPRIPFMLSGGLDTDSVAGAVAALKPFGLDVSSGVEREKGVKDKALIARFIAAARAAAQQG